MQYFQHVIYVPGFRVPGPPPRPGCLLIPRALCLFPSRGRTLKFSLCFPLFCTFSWSQHPKAASGTEVELRSSSQVFLASIDMHIDGTPSYVGRHSHCFSPCFLFMPLVAQKTSDIATHRALSGRIDVNTCSSSQKHLMFGLLFFLFQVCRLEVLPTVARSA